MSLLPLGILSQGGGAGGGGAAFELIQTINGNGSSQTLTFSSIPQTYKHLQVRYVARDVGNASTAQPVSMRYNGETSTYYGHVLTGGYASQVIAENYGANYVGWIPAALGVTGSFGGGIIDILDYTSPSKNATMRSLSGFLNGATAQGYPQGISMIALTSALRTTTTAITSLTFNAQWQAFSSESRFSLYGIKG